MTKRLSNRPAVFALAIHNLFTRGWCSGIRHSEDGKSCLLGAFETSIKDVDAENKYPHEILRIRNIIWRNSKFRHRLQKSGWTNVAPTARIVAAFNDHPSTTNNEIQQVMFASLQQAFKQNPLS